MGVCNSDGGVGDGILDFEGSASAVFELFVDFGPSKRRQDAVVEPLLCWFLCLGRHTGFSDGDNVHGAQPVLRSL